MKKSLFKDFKKTSKKDWLAKVEKDLKGKPLESLNWNLHEDFTISPFAHPEDLSESPLPLHEKRTTNAWELGIRILVKNYKTSNREVLFLLEKGANAICFELEKNPTKKELQTLLAGIELEWISTHFILPEKTWKSIVINFSDLIKEKNLNAKKVKGSFSFKNNNTFTNGDLTTLNSYFESLPAIHFATINGLNFYQGKENIPSELAAILKNVNTLLEKWNNKNLPIKNLVPKVQFAIQLDDSYFLNIAKIRALKILWQMLVKAWNKSLKVSANIEVHLTDISQTKDENYNKIKATSQAMSAVIGGANRLYIYPSDVFKRGKRGTLNQQRLALNIQHLMQLESYMDRVIDPAAGSYFLENLTDQIAEAAWEKFISG